MQKNEIDGTLTSIGRQERCTWGFGVTTLRTLLPTDRGSTAGRNKRCVSPPTVQRGSGDQRAFSSIGNGPFSLGLKWAGHEAHHSPESTVEDKNEWSYTSTTPYAFTTCIGTTLRLSYH